MANLTDSILPNLTHELKTPLHSILTLTELLLTEADGKLSDEQKKQLGLIKKNGDHLLELILDLLQFSSLEGRTKEIVVEEFRPQELFDSVCDAVLPLAERGGVILERDYANTNEKFISDRTLARQIVHNLVTNAVKFTPIGGTVFLFTKTDADGSLIIEVVDSGIGITPDAQKKIFEDFYQAESGESRRFGGIGLGLSLVKAATQALQGTVDLKSEEGQGSLFRVRLPSLVNLLKRQRVLVIESDALLKLTFEELFRKYKFDCKVVEDKADILKELTEWHPELILVDLQSDDFSLLTELRGQAISAQLPIIVISPHGSPEDRASGFRLGASDYLVKPFNNEELLARIRSCLR
jgi:CheY-like chemotaxis protein/two-component sensor histidine kinase